MYTNFELLSVLQLSYSYQRYSSVVEHLIYHRAHGSVTESPEDHKQS